MSPGETLVSHDEKRKGRHHIPFARFLANCSGVRLATPLLPGPVFLSFLAAPESEGLPAALEASRFPRAAPPASVPGLGATSSGPPSPPMDGMWPGFSLLRPASRVGSTDHGHATPGDQLQPSIHPSSNQPALAERYRARPRVALWRFLDSTHLPFPSVRRQRTGLQIRAAYAIGSGMGGGNHARRAWRRAVSRVR